MFNFVLQCLVYQFIISAYGDYQHANMKMKKRYNNSDEGSNTVNAKPINGLVDSVASILM